MRQNLRFGNVNADDSTSLVTAFLSPPFSLLDESFVDFLWHFCGAPTSVGYSHCLSISTTLSSPLNSKSCCREFRCCAIFAVNFKENVWVHSPSIDPVCFVEWHNARLGNGDTFLNSCKKLNWTSSLLQIIWVGMICIRSLAENLQWLLLCNKEFMQFHCMNSFRFCWSLVLRLWSYPFPLCLLVMANCLWRCVKRCVKFITERSACISACPLYDCCSRHPHANFEVNYSRNECFHLISNSLLSRNLWKRICLFLVALAMLTRINNVFRDLLSITRLVTLLFHLFLILSFLSCSYDLFLRIF